jgi:hypothetical protein
MRREFRGLDERIWAVFESLIPVAEWTTADHDTFRAGYGIGWLCFETKGEKRNIRMYPRNWSKLNDGGLIRLWDRSRHGAGRDGTARPAD